MDNVFARKIKIKRRKEKPIVKRNTRSKHECDKNIIKLASTIVQVSPGSRFTPSREANSLTLFCFVAQLFNYTGKITKPFFT